MQKKQKIFGDFKPFEYICILTSDNKDYENMGISKVLTEEDVKFRYINDAITSKGWEKDSIFMEQQVKFTDGKINLHGNLVHRDKPKFTDYVLYANKATPIAIVEAKDANHSVSHGLQQAMTYAQMLDVKIEVTPETPAPPSAECH